MVSNEAEKKLAQLQMIEENLNHLSMKKQAIQSEEFEVNNALEELIKSGDEVYRIVGQIMIKSNKEDVVKDLEEKKQRIELKFKSIEKQESTLQEKAKTIKEEVMGALSKEKEDV